MAKSILWTLNERPPVKENIEVDHVGYETGEMTQFVRCLLYTHEDLGLDLQ